MPLIRCFFELKDLETQSSIEIETLKEQLRQLKDDENEHKQNKEYLEQDLKSVRQQLEYAQEDFFKQKSTFTSKLQEREQEIERLRNQVGSNRPRLWDILQH